MIFKKREFASVGKLKGWKFQKVQNAQISKMKEYKAYKIWNILEVFQSKAHKMKEKRKFKAPKFQTVGFKILEANHFFYCRNIKIQKIDELRKLLIPTTLKIFRPLKLPLFQVRLSLSALKFKCSRRSKIVKATKIFFCYLSNLINRLKQLVKTTKSFCLNYQNFLKTTQFLSLLKNELK